MYILTTTPVAAILNQLCARANLRFGGKKSN